jgi:hypothetical protein
MLQHTFFVWWSEFVLWKKMWKNSCLNTSIGTVSLQWQRIHSFPSFFDVPSNMQPFGFLILWTLCPFHLQIFRMEVTWHLIYIVAHWIVWWRRVKSLREVKYFLVNIFVPTPSAFWTSSNTVPCMGVTNVLASLLFLKVYHHHHVAIKELGHLLTYFPFEFYDN